MMRRNSGFSLTELMVVIAIIGLTAAIATPNMIDWLSRRKQSTSARDVLSTMEFARAIAIRRNGTATVTIVGNNVVTVQLTANGSTTQQRRTQLAAGVRLVQPASGALGTSFSFNNQGIPSATGDLLVRDGKHADKSIQVRTGGNVRIIG
jgi:type IV fimbrial biogenesis protein FimT